MSILDSILDGAQVVSEQHDANRINTDNVGQGQWDAAEYGLTREQIQARLAAARTPEERGKVIADLRERAQRRAGLTAVAGRVPMFSARETPWHALGTVLDRTATSAEAATHGGLQFPVDLVAMEYCTPSGERRASDDTFALVRTDTWDKLATVGKRYQPIQNREGFAFLDSVLGEFGAHYETAGALYGGKRIWILANMPQARFETAPGDVVQPYVLFTNPHGYGKAYAFCTAERVVCANTHTIALRGRDKSKGISIRHTGDMAEKMADARKAFEQSIGAVKRFREQSEALAKAPMPSVQHYANDVLDTVLEVTAADAAKGADVLAAALQVSQAERDLAEKRFDRQIKRRGRILQDILERSESERCQIGGIGGTAWSGYNAVSEYADHAMNYHKDDRESRRFESVVYGRADDLKQTAFELALNYAS